MTREQFECEMRYRTVIAVARTMLARGLILNAEYDAFNREMIEKYMPLISVFKYEQSEDLIRY